MLATLLRPLHLQAALSTFRDTVAGLRHRLLARLHELGAQPLHLHGLQQGLPPRLSSDIV